VLSREDLSYAYPFVALNYIFVTILAWRFLSEKVPPVRIAGLAVIFLGVLIFSFGRAPRPAEPASAIPDESQRIRAEAAKQGKLGNWETGKLGN
jgi:hypothetical protein